MSLESVKEWLATRAPDLRLIEVEESTATVDAAASALGVAPGQIAKTLAVRAGEHLFLLVTRGNARLDNRKCKDELKARPRMLDAEETFELTGHPVGGVCPFGLKSPLPVYFDVSLQAFDMTCGWSRRIVRWPSCNGGRAAVSAFHCAAMRLAFLRS